MHCTKLECLSDSVNEQHILAQKVHGHVLSLIPYYPDEPVFRSLDLLGGTWWIDRYVHKLVLDDIVNPSLKEPTSIVARNREGKIVGENREQLS